MTVRQMIERREQESLVPSAMLSINTKGRAKKIEECPMRTCFQRDRDRIVHSKAFRRLGNKTQVFISPEGDHYRARLTHTIEVSQIARTITRALMLNEDLAEAMSLGHDLGHTPFGHAGERALNDICSEGFKHNQQSKRVVERLEKDGEGLNLTYEVIDGIVCHTGKKIADTLEGQIIHFADRIAYVNHDIDDAIRAGILKQRDIPKEITEVLGENHGNRIDSMVMNMIEYGRKTGKIGMDTEIADKTKKLRAFMFDMVYTNPMAKGEEGKAQDMIKSLYEYYYKNVDKLPYDYQSLMDYDSRARVVCDYIACMTDRYAISQYKQAFIPKSWNKV